MKKTIIGLLTALILFVGAGNLNVRAAVTGCDNTGDSCCLDAISATIWCNNGLSCVKGKCETGASGKQVTCNTGSGVGIDTAIGCIPFGDQNQLIGFFLRWGIGIGGGIAFLLILMAGFQIMTSRGDPKRLQAGQEMMTSAIAGLLLLIFSLVILRIIGFDILGIVSFK
jgi:hypothetical protein